MWQKKPGEIRFALVDAENMDAKHDYSQDQTWTAESHKDSLAQDTELIGKQVGEYKITRELGRGGMAVVYEAYQPSLDRKVVLKILPHSLLQEPQYLERFKREASSAAKLSHPNIVAIHDFGQENSICYYVMDMVRGQSLDRLIEDKKTDVLKSARKFKPEETLKIILQVAEALEYAHKNGIIHRDIKPGNIMIETGARALVTDFGLAKSERWEKITARASLFGTPAYMSPEQAAGKKLDLRTDIYSLGAVLYEMLTGHPPYPGENALEVIDKVKNEPVPSPRKIDPSISPALESITLKAMSRQIHLRYRSMTEFINDIKNFTKGTMATAFFEAAEQKISRRKQSKKKSISALLYIIIFVSTVILMGLWLQRVKAHKANAHASSKFQLAENYEWIGMPEEAEKVYREIQDNYPTSIYAERAKERLREIGGG